MPRARLLLRLLLLPLVAPGLASEPEADGAALCAARLSAARAEAAKHQRKLAGSQATAAAQDLALGHLVDAWLASTAARWPGGKWAFVQIGAHTADEKNDPFRTALERAGWSAVFVEPAPAAFRALDARARNHTRGRGRWRAVRAAVDARCPPPPPADAAAADGGDGSTVTFYAISEDIDLRTGLDRRSGAQLEFWVTQISSLDRARIVGNAAFQAHFRSRGLALDEHVDARRARRRG